MYRTKNYSLNLLCWQPISTGGARRSSTSSSISIVWGPVSNQQPFSESKTDQTVGDKDTFYMGAAAYHRDYHVADRLLELIRARKLSGALWKDSDSLLNGAMGQFNPANNSEVFFMHVRVHLYLLIPIPLTRLSFMLPNSIFRPKSFKANTIYSSFTQTRTRTSCTAMAKSG